MIIKQIRIMDVNKNNINGIYYSREVIQTAIDNIKEPLIGTTNYNEASKSTNIDLTKVSLMASNFRINKDDVVLCDIKILDTPDGIELQKKMPPHMSGIRDTRYDDYLEQAFVSYYRPSFKPLGLGMIDEKGICIQYNFHSVNLFSL